MSVAAQPLAGVFEADRNHSSFQFGVRHMKVSTFRATFGDVEARLTAEEDGITLEGAARAASISITEPLELREHVVRGSDFFDADNHPELRFRSNRVELGEDGRAEVEGTLTIKGIDKTVIATGTFEPPIQDPYGAERTALELHATVDRRDWDMTWQTPLPDGDDVLGWDVELSIQLELVKRS